MADVGGLPSNITFGTVKGKVVNGLQLDTGNPDAQPASGLLTFTPSVKQVTDVGAQTLILLNNIQVQLQADGSFEVSLVATDNAYLNPTDFSYKVSSTFGMKPIDIKVPSNSITDLTAWIPVASSGGITITQGPPGPEGPPGPQGPAVSDDTLNALLLDEGSAVRATLDDTYLPRSVVDSTIERTVDTLLDGDTSSVRVKMDALYKLPDVDFLTDVNNALA